MKALAKKLVVAVLNWQVRRLYKKNSFKVIAVAGSVGKTSTKLAIAQALSVRYKVQYQKGNYNDVVTVPLVFFGLRQPSLMNPLAWLSAFLKIESALRKQYPYEVVVVELGTDYKGNLAKFKPYLKADIGVITAIAMEHMEFFDDLDAVAEEELTVAGLSRRLLANADLSRQDYLKPHQGMLATYAIDQTASYTLKIKAQTHAETGFEIHKGKTTLTIASYPTLFASRLYSILAAASVCDMLGMTEQEIRAGIAAIEPVAGRMRLLEGVNGSTIIDDSYNASPDAVKAALDALYKIDAAQKIAILGNMNELGAYSEEAHREIGRYCDPKQLDLVATLGPDANKHLAPAAEAGGCKVETFESPYDLAQRIREHIKPGSAILAKGSQNRVFAEEAVKCLLAHSSDRDKLVRQNNYWMAIKKKQFGEPPQ